MWGRLCADLATGIRAAGRCAARTAGREREQGGLRRGRSAVGWALLVALCVRARVGVSGHWRLSQRPPPQTQPPGVERRQLLTLMAQKGGRPSLALRARSAEDSRGSEVCALASSEAALRAGEAGHCQSHTGGYGYRPEETKSLLQQYAPEVSLSGEHAAPHLGGGGRKFRLFGGGEGASGSEEFLQQAGGSAGLQPHSLPHLPSNERSSPSAHLASSNGDARRPGVAPAESGRRRAPDTLWKDSASTWAPLLPLAHSRSSSLSSHAPPHLLPRLAPHPSFSVAWECPSRWLRTRRGKRSRRSPRGNILSRFQAASSGHWGLRQLPPLSSSVPSKSCHQPHCPGTPARPVRGMTSEADLPCEREPGQAACRQSALAPGRDSQMPRLPTQAPSPHEHPLPSQAPLLHSVPPMRLAMPRWAPPAPSLSPLLPPLSLPNSPPVPQAGRASWVTCRGAGRPSQKRVGCAPAPAALGRGGLRRQPHHRRGQRFPCAGARGKRGHPASDHKLLGGPAETKVPSAGAPEAAVAPALSPRAPAAVRGP